MRPNALSLQLLALLLLATACGGSQSGQTTTPSGNGTAETDEQEGPPPDASRPEDAVGLLRTGPLHEVLTAFIPPSLPISADTVPFDEVTGGDPALAEHVDRSRGLQLLLGRETAVVSVGITGELPADRLTPGARGELDHGAKWALDRAADPERGTSGHFCIATPAADGNRLICGDDREKLVRAAPYMAHTVAGMRLAEPVVRFEALLDSQTASRIRERAPQKIAEAVAEIEQKLNETTEGVLANADVRREIMGFVRGVADAVRSVIVDAREGDITLSVREGSYVVEGRARFATISSDWFAALMSAFRTPAGWPTELFARLPPDAVSYSIGSSDSRNVAVILDQMKLLVDALIGSATTLPPAERTALRTALDAFFTPEVATVAAASNMGNNSWNVMLAHTVEGPTPAERIARFRALRTALARRPLAASLETLLTVSGHQLFLMREVRDMSAREVPAGGYGIRFKVHAPAARATDADGIPAPCGTTIECALRELAPQTDTTYELILAPLGNDFVLAFGRNARALLASVTASTGPGLTPGEPAMAEAFILPSRLIARASEQMGGPAVNVNAGDLPIRMRLEPAGEGPGGLIDLDLWIPVAFVEAMVNLSMGGMSSAPTAAPATP